MQQQISSQSFANKIRGSLSASGGLSYHYLAWKYHCRLWTTFTRQLNESLGNWRHFSKDLILIGPSGGYSLSSSFLASFGNIYVYDPDPIAHWIFKKRFPKISIHWNETPVLFHPNVDSLRGLWFLKTQHPNAALLLCNVLGQWPLLERVDASQMKNWCESLQQIFSGSQWASYHDLFSTAVSIKKIPQTMLVNPLPLLIESHDVERFWYNLGAPSVTDHLTLNIFNNARVRKQLLWPLTPKQLHLIEWVHG